MWRICVLASFASFALLGCAAPGAKLGPPPGPILGTRPPPMAPALPTPELPPPPPPREVAPSLGGLTIVVDPGHGGADPGALGRGALPEKDINLDIARNLARLLEERGANVIMSRSTDRFISLDGRAALADRTRTDLFVSIHADSARRASAEGLTVYVGRNSSTASRRAAQHIVAALQRAGFETRGVHTAGYRVLVAHSRPAVLIECGFLSNRGEAHQLSTASYRVRVAEVIAEGISDHFSD